MSIAKIRMKSLVVPPHPNLLPPGEKGLFAPSPLRGEGWGEGDSIVLSSLWYKILMQYAG